MTPGEVENAEENLRRADQALRVTRLLLEAGALEDAASRVYYSAFHAARAALTVRGRYAKTHSGQITLFEANFGPTPIIRDLFELRGQADYGAEPFRTSREELEDRLVQATAFVEQCRGLVTEISAAGPDEPDPPPDY